MGRPYGFTVGEKHFALYPVTLGKMYLLQRQLESLEVNLEGMKNVSSEALRLAKEKKEECLTIIAYHTCKTKDEIFNPSLISERKELFSKELSEEDIAALMIIVLTSDKTELFIGYLGIDKEQQKLSVVMKAKAKGDKNSLSFGGRSVYGTLIDAASERYGWTKDYIVWGIDYSSLRLMLADKLETVFVTDEERKNIPSWVFSDVGDAIKATRENMAQIKSMDWK